MTMTCAKCKFFMHLATECHAEPPKVFPMMQAPGQMSFVGVFPPTKASNWCGKFEADIKIDAMS